MIDDLSADCNCLSDKGTSEFCFWQGDKSCEWERPRMCNLCIQYQYLRDCPFFPGNYIRPCNYMSNGCAFDGDCSPTCEIIQTNYLDYSENKYSARLIGLIVGQILLSWIPGVNTIIPIVQMVNAVHEFQNPETINVCGKDYTPCQGPAWFVILGFIFDMLWSTCEFFCVFCKA